MLDQIVEEPFVVTECVPTVPPTSTKLHHIDDVTGAVLAVTGADDFSLHYVASSRTQPGQGALPLSAFPALEHKLALLQAEVQSHVRSGAIDDRPFWLTKYDHILCIPLTKADPSLPCIALTYPSELSHARRRILEERARTIAPLLRSNLQMTNKLADASRKHDAAMNVVDNSQVSTMVFDNLGQMVFANKAARQCLANEDGIRTGMRGPVPIALKDANRFQLALEHQIAENASSLQEEHASTVFLIHRKTGQRPFVATMSPVPRAATTDGEPAVMLRLFDPSTDYLDHLDAVCKLYGLSRVEARLVHAIACGQTIEEAAGTMRIKGPTARTYLKHIFTKTSTRRQIDLVRLLRLSTGPVISRKAPEALI